MSVADSRSWTRSRDAIARHDWQRALDAARARPLDDPRRRGRPRRPPGRRGVVARPARRLHRGARARLPHSTTSSATAARRPVRGVAVGAPRLPGPPAIASGWLRRARRALDGDTECAEYGSLLLREAEIAHGAAELDRALELANRSARARPTAAVGRPRGGGAADRGPDPHRPGRAGRRDGAPRRGDALRRRGPAAAVLHRQGVLQPDRRLRGGRRLRPRGRVDRGHAALGGGQPPLRHLPGHLPGAPRRRAQAARRAGRGGGRGGPRLRGARQSHLANSAAAYAEVGDIRRRLGDLDRGGGGVRPIAGDQRRTVRRARAAPPRPGPGRRRHVDDHATASRAPPTRWPAPDCCRCSSTSPSPRATSRRRTTRRPSSTASWPPSTPRTCAPSRCRPGAGCSSREADPARAETLRQAAGRWRALDVPYEEATARTLLGQALRDGGDEAAADGVVLDRGGAVRPDRRPARRPARLRRQQARAAGRSHRAGGRGAPPHRRRPDQQRDRRPAVPEREDGLPPPLQHLHEDRRVVPGRGDRLRLRAPPGGGPLGTGSASRALHLDGVMRAHRPITTMGAMRIRAVAAVSFPRSSCWPPSDVAVATVTGPAPTSA